MPFFYERNTKVLPPPRFFMIARVLDPTFSTLGSFPHTMMRNHRSSPQYSHERRLLRSLYYYVHCGGKSLKDAIYCATEFLKIRAVILHRRGEIPKPSCKPKELAFF